MPVLIPKWLGKPTVSGTFVCAPLNFREMYGFQPTLSFSLFSILTDQQVLFICFPPKGLDNMSLSLYGNQEFNFHTRCCWDTGCRSCLAPLLPLAATSVALFCSASLPFLPLFSPYINLFLFSPQCRCYECLLFKSRKPEWWDLTKQASCYLSEID